MLTVYTLYTVSMLSLPIVLSTFVVIFLAELPDKTAFASLMLATRYGTAQVITGAWLAMLVQVCIAVFAGSLLTLLPAQPVRIAASLLFLLFALVAFRRREDAHEGQEVTKEVRQGRPAWLASFLVVFSAEWGDLSQLAIAGLVARIGNPLSVGIGAVLGLWLVMAFAAVAGSQLNRFLTPKRLNLLSGTLFAIIGIAMIVSSFGL